MAKVLWKGHGDYAGPGGLVIHKGEAVEVTDAQLAAFDEFVKLGVAEVVKAKDKAAR